LLPQSLVTHAGLKAAGSLRCARVMRIAVHPAVQRKGLGRQLLRTIKEDAEKQGIDLLGTSFGATESLLYFWQQEEIFPVRLGFRRGHASGEYSVLMLTALSAAGALVYAAARARFTRDLPQWLADPLQKLDVAVSACLRQATDNGTEQALDETYDREMLISFAKGERTYEDALGPIWRLLAAADKQGGGAPAGIEHDVLLSKVLKGQSWAAVAEQFTLTGKAEVLGVLRKAVAQRLG
jgi:tRNA(Met) cytidine acetyltransferase